MKITPGFIDEDIKVTEVNIDIFHDRMNKEQYDVIVEAASELLQKTLDKDT